MAIRTVTFTVDNDMKVSPRAAVYGGVQGEHNATEVVFTFAADSPLTSPGLILYIEVTTSVGGYDKTDTLVPEDNAVHTLIPLAWTQYGAVTTLRLVAEQDGVVMYTAEGCVRFDERQTAAEKVDGILRGEIGTYMEKCKALDALASDIDAKLKNGEFVGEKGEKGEKGDKGDKGDTPAKGVDYYTETDKAWLVDEISSRVTDEKLEQAAAELVADATEYDVVLDEDITDTLILEVGYYWSKTLNKTYQGVDVFACTELISVSAGDKFKVSSQYGYYTPLIAEFDSKQAMISYTGVADVDTDVVAYEYTVPEGVCYISINSRNTKYNPIILKKVVRDDIKRHVAINEESITKLNGMAVYADNGIKNGDFKEVDNFTAIGGTLTAADGVGTVVADKSSINVGFCTSFGGYTKGDKVFFKAGIKAPFGVGGSVAQNQTTIWIYNNFATGMKYAVNNLRIIDVAWNDYYGIIEFDGDYSATPTYFVAQYNNTNFIPDGAKVEFRGVMAVNLTKAFGAGNEPTADEFYTLLDGYDGKWFDGKVNLFSHDAELRRILNKSPLTANMSVTVGEGGDFLTINKAIEYLSKFYPVYKKGGTNCNVKVLAGTVINEQIFVNQIDLQYITITAEAGTDNTEVIDIDGTSHTMVIVDVDATGFGHTANAHDARGNYPFIAGENAAKLPTIGCLFRLLPNTVEDGKTVCGMLCNRGSAGVVLAASGFDGFNDGVIANNESSITIREGISRNMTRWGVHARHNGEVSARSCICTNCGIGACADRVADLDVREAVLDGSTVAIECNNISRANANGCHANYCGAEGGCVVIVSGGGMANCGALETTGNTGTLYNIAVNTLTSSGIIFV